MLIDYTGCAGYAFLHEEGASCDLCHRLQQPVFSSRTEKNTEEEEVFKPIALVEFAFYQRLNFCKNK